MRTQTEAKGGLAAADGGAMPDSTKHASGVGVVVGLAAKSHHARLSLQVLAAGLLGS